jgi:putative MATE family efflux protein
MLITMVFHVQILQLLNCPEEAWSEAVNYMMITALGMPFIYGYNAVSGVLRGMGESQRPLLFVVVAATINIFLDLFLVVVIPMQAAGTAIATVASQIGAFVAAYLYMYKRREQFDFKLSFSYFKVDKPALRIILKLGIPQLVRSITVHGCMLWVKANVNSFGLLSSSTYSIGNKIEKFVLLFEQGVTSAAGAMIGQNLGARKQDRVRKTIMATLLFALALTTVGAVLFLTIPTQLYRVFTVDQDVCQLGIVFLRIMTFGCFVTTISGTFKALATGAGAVKLCFMLGIMDGVSRVVIDLILTMGLGMGVEGFYWGDALCELVTFAMAFTYFISGKWKTPETAD